MIFPIDHYKQMSIFEDEDGLINADHMSFLKVTEIFPKSWLR